MSTDRISWVVVHKAVSSDETAPKPKHVRRIIVATWKTNGGVFYDKLVLEPLTTSSLVAWKSLITVHFILQSGAPKFIMESHRKIGLFSNLESIWSKAHTPYAQLAVPYSSFLRDKINFHHKNPEFEGTMELSDYLKKTEGRFDPDRSIQLVQMFLNMQEDIIKLEIAIFNSSPLNECKVSALIPLVKESYAIYTHLVHHFRKLGEVLDSLDSIGKLTERFYTQYINLRTFFEKAGKIRYVSSTIAVPVLPKDPPTFVVKGRAPSVQRHSVVVKHNEKAVTPVPVAVPVVQVKQLNLAEMEQAIAKTTQQAQPLPMLNVSATPYSNSRQGDSSNEPLFLRLRTTHPSAYTPFGPYPERKTEIPSGWVKFSSPVSGVTVPPSGAAPVEVNDGTERELAELRSRLSSLLEAAQKEKEKNALLEEQIANRDAVLQKWKDAYAELLKAHDAVSAERDQLLKQKQEAEERLANYMNTQAQQLRGLTLGELDDAMRSLEQALYNLDNPDFAGNEKSTPQDVTDNASDLITSIDKAIDAWSRGSETELARAIKVLGGKANAILIDAKGVARLADDPLVKQGLFDAARLAAASTQRLLDLLRNQPDNKEAIAEATAIAKRDAREVEKAIEALLNAEQVEAPSESSEQLTDLASQELLKAAKIIEEAVAALTATAKARSNKPKLPEGEVDVADAILEASLAISRATASLVASAALAQKEFVAAGKASPNPAGHYAKSRTFSEGLISAAQAVAAATAELVKQANGVATGKFEEEGLIAASKAVSAATKQLVVASRVKADDPNSPAQRKLEEASSSVAAATQALVAAARALAKPDVEPPIPTAAGLAGFKILEMEQQMKILKLEKDLETARKSLAGIRKQEYKK